MPEDRELIENFLHGDETAFVPLMKKYLKPLYGFAFQLTRDRSAAEDIVQESFIKAWKHLSRFDMQKSFKTWIFAIVRNTAYDFLKKKKSIPFSFFENADGSNRLHNIPEESVVPEAVLDQEATALDLEEKLEQLDPEYRAILLLRYKEDFSLHEIAEILGEPYNTVKSRHQRALQSLRRAFS